MKKQWLLAVLATCMLGAVAVACDGGWADASSDSQAVHTHNYTTTMTAPTCSAQGFTTFVCACGDSYIGDYKDPIPHSYETAWAYNETHHWKNATCDCDGQSEYAEHIDEGGVCSVCEALLYTQGVLYQMSSEGTYAVVTGYEGTATKVKIASTYQGVPVTEMGNSAFYNQDKMEEVILPNTVTTIERSAFAYCYSLTKVNIPDGVTSIGASAFRDCRNLTDVNIPDGVTVIEEKVFAYCNSLTDVSIPDGVTSIGGSAFYHCDSLTNVLIPDSVTSIGILAFGDCGNLQYSEYGNAKYLGNADNAYFALMVVSRQDYSSYTIHSDTKVIADYSFESCWRLTKIEIPDGVNIGEGAFWSCTALTTVTMGNVESIGVGAFDICTALTTVTIGNVESIGESAFAGCAALTEIVFKGTMEEWNAVYKGDSWCYQVSAAEVVCLDGTVAIG